MTGLTFKDWLDLLASFSVIISAAAAGFAAVFVSRQLFQMKKTREADILMRIVNMSNSGSIREASDWIKYSLSDKVTYEQAFEEVQAWHHISTVVHHFEMIGVLVERDHVPKDLIFDQMGAWIVGSWLKLDKLISAHRTHKRYPDYAENFEMLAIEYEEWSGKNPPKLEKRKRALTRDLATYYSSAAPRQTQDIPPKVDESSE